jgi:hypothetical protein
VEDRGAATAGGIGRAHREPNFDDDTGAQAEVSENSVGEAVVSGILWQREGELAAGWKALWTQNRARTARLQTEWSGCESESGFEKGNPGYKQISVSALVIDVGQIQSKP